jgi:hypothetical protein
MLVCYRQQGWKCEGNICAPIRNQTVNGNDKLLYESFFMNFSHCEKREGFIRHIFSDDWAFYVNGKGRNMSICLPPVET